MTDQTPAPLDWADELATELMAWTHRFSFREARELVAARLRQVRLEGESIGIHTCIDQITTNAEPAP